MTKKEAHSKGSRRVDAAEMTTGKILTMNDLTYAKLKEIAREIREDAVSRNDGKAAVANFNRATGYLFEQIHSANEITFGDKNSFADSLINLAERIKSK